MQKLTFQNVKDFLVSWGMHFDSRDGESTNIPYPQVYERMKEDAGDVGGSELQRFISRITDTTDGETYLVPESWDYIEEFWNTDGPF